MKKIIMIASLLAVTTIANASYQVVIHPKAHLNEGDIVFSKIKPPTNPETPPIPPEPEVPVIPEPPVPPKDEDRAGYTCQNYSESSNYAMTFNTSKPYPTGMIRYIKWSNAILIDSVYTQNKYFPFVSGQYTYVLGSFNRADTKYNYYKICRYPNL
jgi:hypothetical protein